MITEYKKRIAELEAERDALQELVVNLDEVKRELIKVTAELEHYKSDKVLVLGRDPGGDKGHYPYVYDYLIFKGKCYRLPTAKSC